MGEGTNGIVWEDPSPVKRATRVPSKWARILSEVQKRPGVWARVAVFDNKSKAYAASAALRSRRLKVPAGRWEFTSRNAGTGQAYVYACYLGPDEQS